MPRRSTVWGLAVLLALASMAVCYLWWRSSPYATVLPQQAPGAAVIETNASEQALAAAILDVTSRFRNYVEKPDGTKSDPTYRAWSRTSRRGKGVEAGDNLTAETVQSHVEFRDRGGRLVQVDTKYATDKPTRVTITYQPPGDPAILTDEILRGLDQRAVRIR